MGIWREDLTGEKVWCYQLYFLQIVLVVQLLGVDLDWAGNYNSLCMGQYLLLLLPLLLILSSFSSFFLSSSSSSFCLFVFCFFFFFFFFTLIWPSWLTGRKTPIIYLLLLLLLLLLFALPLSFFLSFFLSVFFSLFSVSSLSLSSDFTRPDITSVVDLEFKNQIYLSIYISVCLSVLCLSVCLSSSSVAQIGPLRLTWR